MENTKSYLIGIDASRAFVKEATGTENYSLNLLRALAKIDRKNQYRVYLRSVVITQARLGIARQAGLGFGLGVGNLGEWPRNFEFKIIKPNRLWTQVGLALEIWRRPVDILFIPAHTLPILRRRNIGFSMENRTKYVVTIHDLGVEYLPGYHQFPGRYYLDFASRYAAWHADAIIAPSAATKRDLIKRYGIKAKKISVVHEGVDRRFFRPRPEKEIKNQKSKIKIDGNYILFVGTIQPRKNLAMLIEAFSIMVHSRQSTVHRQPLTDNCQLVLAGKLGWDYQDILSAPKKFGVEKSVKFIGRVKDADLPALYSGASVFAYPSLFEGFGLPILEALACGCPVIASDIGPHREIFEKISSQSGKSILRQAQDDPESIEGSKWKVKENSLYTSDFDFDSKFTPITLAKPNDSNQWSQFLYQYISQYEKRQTLATKISHLASNFSWDEAARQTLKVFERVQNS